ncbi:sulfite exporter TauE/SafE family protein [Jeotgalibacillus marinus]|uniref:Probable membrane transporter protein n=1 Tax=Jeotgalibacillus marinus TaxID=86667 RepID=A0ABV3Q5R0_9BACL
MSATEISLLCMFIFIAAILYSAVGHGGASGYLAAMALFGVSPFVMKPVGLVLNLLVSGLASVRFYRAKFFSWSIFLPFALPAIPFAYLGGALQVPSHTYKIIAGVVLLFSAYHFVVTSKKEEKDIKKIPLFFAILSGMGMGFLSGIIGVGGGIFLSPLLLLLGWATTKQTSGIAALFIFVNSLSGLLGHISSVQMLPSYWPYLAVSAIAGGLIGSNLGTKRLNKTIIRRTLAIVLVIAGLKLIFV